MAKKQTTEQTKKQTKVSPPVIRIRSHSTEQEQRELFEIQRHADDRRLLARSITSKAWEFFENTTDVASIIQSYDAMNRMLYNDTELAKKLSVAFRYEDCPALIGGETEEETTLKKQKHPRPYCISDAVIAIHSMYQRTNDTRYAMAGEQENTLKFMSHLLENAFTIKQLQKTDPKHPKLKEAIETYHDHKNTHQRLAITGT